MTSASGLISAAAFLLTALPGIAAAGPATAEDPMAPFVSIARHLEAGANALLAGESAAAALQPWAFEKTPSGSAQLREELQAEGVKKLVVIGFEFEPYLSGSDGPLGALRTVIDTSGASPGLVVLELRTPGDGGERSARHHPAEQWNGPRGDFGEGARRLLKLLRSDRCAEVPVPDGALWKGTPMEEETAGDIDRLRAELAATCKALAGAVRATHIRVDDFGLVGLSDDGTALGVLGGDFEIQEGGELLVEFSSRFRPFPKPEPNPAATSEPGASSPEATWKRLLAAVAARDLEAYTACFLPESRKREGGVDRLKEDPALWDELAGVLREPQTFSVESTSGDTARCRVHAPEADGGGIGGLTMERAGGEWFIRSW